MIGKVYLIGAGPGDPELLSLKGLRCLQQADCVIYDYLVNPELLVHAPAEAERIFVGKVGGQKSITQEQISALVLNKAKAGKTVARLKGGDPFVFGRGGEEAEELARAGVPFEIVPGITSGYAAPAYAGIPVTHRDFSPSVAFITGHEDPQKETSMLAWDKVATGIGTLVFFMGVRNLPEIVENLVRHGRSPETPVALIQWGTLSRQEVVTGTLSNIVNQAEAAGLSSPAITIVGDVVRLREGLRWFEKRPLFGKRILITRPREQSEALRSQLSALGAEVISFPTIEIQAPDSWTPLDRAIQQIEDYHWLLFTSVNGVRSFFSRFRVQRRDIRDLKHLRIATIGPATQSAVQELLLQVEVLPDDFKAEGLLESLRDKVLKGQRVLLPRAKEAREILPIELQKQGAQVDVVEAYQSVLPPISRERLDEVFLQTPIDMIVFTSSSTVTNLARILAPLTPRDVLAQTAVACIGPITTQTARDWALEVAVQPSQYQVSALIDAILDYFSKATAEPK
ncbi:MAG: uroporphyrinogen-III C-methyltransferase [Acidobacteriota bacterium]